MAVARDEAGPALPPELERVREIEVTRLADEFGALANRAAIAELVSEALTGLARGARIRDYLGVLVHREVRDSLRRGAPLGGP